MTYKHNLHTNKTADTKKFTIITPTESELKWYKLKQGSYIIEFERFWSDCLCGVNKESKYYDELCIGFQLSSNLGTYGVGVIDVNKAIEILKNNGYTQKN